MARKVSPLISYDGSSFVQAGFRVSVFGFAVCSGRVREAQPHPHLLDFSQRLHLRQGPFAC